MKAKKTSIIDRVNNLSVNDKDKVIKIIKSVTDRGFDLIKANKEFVDIILKTNA